MTITNHFDGCPRLRGRSPVTRCLLLAGLLLMVSSSGCTESSGQTNSAFKPVTEEGIPLKRERVTRLFWQDRTDASLKWGDLYAVEDGKDWQLQPETIDGFPSLDAEQQNLVQMRILQDTLLAGVRDTDRGAFESGWVAIDTGVREQPHGDHSDWSYESVPSIRLTRLDNEQGNPAHLYVYDGAFYLANDASNGFTRIVPDKLSSKSGTFYSGGGRHITLAAIDNAVAYSTWIDRDGSNQGRVDVVNLQPADSREPAYSFHLPSGGIHGATANSGRIFLAPAEGICWVDADLDLAHDADSVTVNHVSLGDDPETDRPRRTGAFVNHRNWVLFTTGNADASALCLVDAAARTPAVVEVAIDVPDGLSLVTPKVIRSQSGKRYAFVFQDRKEGDIEEQLTIVDLDPDGDRDFSDAGVVKTIPTGPSKVEGHFGHHAVCFDPGGTIACVSNPGDGTLWIIRLTNLDIASKLTVGGTPSTLTATGGSQHH